LVVKNAKQKNSWKIYEREIVGIVDEVKQRERNLKELKQSLLTGSWRSQATDPCLREE